MRKRFSISSPVLSIVSALSITLTACHPSDKTWNPQVAAGWRPSSYALSQTQTLKLSNESRAAKRNGEREVCGGLLLRSDGQLALCFTPNESPDPRSFMIAKSNLERMSELAANHEARLIGSFHSHPASDAMPGEDDLSGAGVNSLILIHSVRSGQTRLWQVVPHDHENVAVEVQLEVLGRRPRSASTLIPSRREQAQPHPAWDLR